MFGQLLASISAWVQLREARSRRADALSDAKETARTELRRTLNDCLRAKALVYSPVPSSFDPAWPLASVEKVGRDLGKEFSEEVRKLGSFLDDARSQWRNQMNLTPASRMQRTLESLALVSLLNDCASRAAALIQRIR